MSFPSWYPKPTSFDSDNKKWVVIAYDNDRYMEIYFESSAGSLLMAWHYATTEPELTVKCRRV